MITILIFLHTVIFAVQRFAGGGIISEIGFYVCLLLFYIHWIIKEALDRYEKIKKSEKEENEEGGSK